MENALHITYQGLEASPAIDAEVREKVAKLEQFHGRLTSCRVVVARPHAHHNQGNTYEVHIEISLPGIKDVIVSRDPGRDHAHEDVHVAIRDAFDAARRQLIDHVSKANKHH